MAIVAAGIIVAFLTLVLILSPQALAVAICGIFYTIAKGLFSICDFLQRCFRKLAGLETYYYKEANVTNAKTGDVLITLFSSKTVIEALIAMTLFAVALLLIVTIVQIIRVEYTTEGSKNSKGTIIGKAIKSFAMFILVPVVCFLGIFTSNKILFALDAATAQAGSSTLSGCIFLAGAADANVIRMGGTTEGVVVGLAKKTGPGYKAKFDDNTGGVVGFKSVLTSNKTSTENKRHDIATKIDNMFVKVDNRVKMGDIKSEGSECDVNDDQTLWYHNYTTTRYFYDFTKMNFFVFYVGSAFVLMSLFKASIGLIMRLYKATALFIISPAVTALTPLDDGNAYKSWRKAFIGSVLGAYGFVVALNLMFLLMGVIDNIYLFEDTWYNYVQNKMVQCLIILVGVNMLSDLSGLVSGFIGAEDALKTGGDMSGKVGKSVKSIGKFAGSAVMVGAGIYGAISSKINTKKALNAKAKGNHEANVKAYEDAKGELVGLEKGTPEYNKKLKKVEKAEKKMNESSADGQQRKYLSRAASGAIRAKRAGEIFGSALQDSPIGSFLNNITGGYVEAFGGKATKNLDDKLKIPGSTLDSLAAERGPNIIKRAGGVIGKVVNPVEWLAGSAEDDTTNANNTFERNQVLAKAAKKTQQHYAGFGLESDDEIEKYRKKEKSNVTIAESLQKGLDDLKSGIEKKSNYPQNQFEGNKKAFIKKFGKIEGMNNLEGVDEASRKLIERILSGLKNSKNIDEALKSFEGFDQGSIKPRNYDDYIEKRTRAGEAARGLDRDLIRNGATNTMPDYVRTIEEYEAARESLAATENNHQGANGTGNGRNIDANGASVSINDAKIEAKQTTINKADIKDTSAIGNKLKEALDNEYKQMEKDKEDNKVYEMLNKMNKTLEAIKKNTKK